MNKNFSKLKTYFWCGQSGHGLPNQSSWWNFGRHSF